MSARWRLTPQQPTDVDSVVEPVFAGELPAELSPAFLAGSGFSGALGQVLHLPGEPVRVLLGCGPRAAFDATATRTAAAHLARAVPNYRRLALHAPGPHLRHLAEGYLLGSYRYPGHFSAEVATTRTPPDQLITLVVPPAPDTTPEPAWTGPGLTAGTAHPDATSDRTGPTLTTSDGRPTPDRTGPSVAPTAADGAPTGSAPSPRSWTGPSWTGPGLRGGACADPETALAAGLRIGEAVRLARDLVNEPGQELTPPVFAERALKLAAETGLECEVWDAQRIAHERLGGLLGVSRGSLVPPRLVRLRYRPAGATRRIALVGKGVTYDAGGLALKPNAELATMKADMAGAATVLAAMSTLTTLNCPVAVDGWLPLTENMPNADPIRVGDVLRMRSGTTVEVRHADAEGRLIMADALTLAAETRPDAILDLATLTDAAAVALGRRIAAVLGTDPALVARVQAAGARAGERCWPLPLPEEYRGQLDSRVADLVNYTIGVRHGTAMLAALFLREFVPTGIPWAHLDIQGTALSDLDDPEWGLGGTGFGVRTLVELLVSGG
ncbi:M17 family peptidase N-terminal domain-containing protein [Kitasatospora sp. NPDC002227]|uniref:leucyl aminopeptidase family protein n=1 Tax=Kitasatospora sp. NPDC002227 TaxID=3154773 RepID=UPI00332F440D